jgi:hypothetical protein
LVGIAFAGGETPGRLLAMSDEKPEESEDETKPKHPHPHLHHLEEQAEKAVEDIAEFFEAGGSMDTPTSDSDAPAP